jgi:hypothetical protein
MWKFDSIKASQCCSIRIIEQTSAHPGPSDRRPIGNLHPLAVSKFQVFPDFFANFPRFSFILNIFRICKGKIALGVRTRPTCMWVKHTNHSATLTSRESVSNETYCILNLTSAYPVPSERHPLTAGNTAGLESSHGFPNFPWFSQSAFPQSAYPYLAFSQSAFPQSRHFLSRHSSSRHSPSRHFPLDGISSVGISRSANSPSRHFP